jgi:hypothetical protein
MAKRKSGTVFLSSATGITITALARTIREGSTRLMRA